MKSEELIMMNEKFSLSFHSEIVVPNSPKEL
jgi:hypothetical protein